MCHEPGARRRQRGVVAIEVALLMTLFVLLIFMVLEVARIAYLWNTAQEVTRAAARGAAVSDFSAAAQQRVRQHAIFRDSPGKLFLSTEIDDNAVRIDYLWLSRNAGADNTHARVLVTAPPACPLRNIINCNANPYAANCVRLVRARLCRSDTTTGECLPLPYVPMLPSLISWIQGSNPLITVPTFETVVMAESLGYVPGAPDCP